jgi:glycosyltransferase involved in cell wall biosynthesis
MNTSAPRVSVGIPVLNGQDYLADALDSILAQTFADFEIVISDNASTDLTPDICRTYAARDARIRYHRNPGNLGAAKNYSRVFELSNGEYFKWAAHDDEIAPTFLSRCVEVLDRDSDIVGCHTKVLLIDSRGRLFGAYQEELARIGSSDPAERFAGVLLDSLECFQFFGLMRSKVLRTTSLHGAYAGSDRVLVAEMSLRGSLHEVPEYLFYSREHKDRFVRRPFTEVSAWYDPDMAGRVVFHRWRFLRALVGAIRRSPLSYGDKLDCLRHLGTYLRKDYNWAWLPADLLVGLQPRLRDPIHRLLESRIRRRLPYKLWVRDQ